MTSSCNQTLISVLRKSLPQIIANEIVGVQPMGGEYNLYRYWSNTAVMKKVHYQHFLKLYNRKKSHRLSDLEEAGYPVYKIDILDSVEAKEWCQKNLREGTWVRCMQRFSFAYQSDAARFSLVW